MAGNQLTDRDAQHFIDPLRNNMSLTCLDLSHNNLGEMAGLHIAAALVRSFLSSKDGMTDYRFLIFNVQSTVEVISERNTSHQVTIKSKSYSLLTLHITVRRTGQIKLNGLLSSVQSLDR